MGVLKNDAIFKGKPCAEPCRPSFIQNLRWLLLYFRGRYFFQLNLVFITESRTGFRFELLWKHKLKVRSSHWNSSVKKNVLRNFASFTGKQLCWSLSNRVADLEVCSFIRKRPQHKCFPVEFTKFLRTPNLKSPNACFWNMFFLLLDSPF